MVPPRPPSVARDQCGKSHGHRFLWTWFLFLSLHLLRKDCYPARLRNRVLATSAKTIRNKPQTTSWLRHYSRHLCTPSWSHDSGCLLQALAEMGVVCIPHQHLFSARLSVFLSTFGSCRRCFYVRPQRLNSVCLWVCSTSAAVRIVRSTIFSSRTMFEHEEDLCPPPSICIKTKYRRA